MELRTGFSIEKPNLDFDTIPSNRVSSGAVVLVLPPLQVPLQLDVMQVSRAAVSGETGKDAEEREKRNPYGV
eukprot:scaffold6438_cov181-Amphora_coffeaeformis.AAC.5